MVEIFMDVQRILSLESFYTCCIEIEDLVLLNHVPINSDLNDTLLDVLSNCISE